MQDQMVGSPMNVRGQRKQKIRERSNNQNSSGQVIQSAAPIGEIKRGAEMAYCNMLHLSFPQLPVYNFIGSRCYQWHSEWPKCPSHSQRLGRS
ncbi:hypothetical protein MHYP_G00128950 [Metynnis hypsauchen]